MTIQARHSSHSTVLVVEQDALMLTAMSALLDMQGYKVILARTEQVACQAIEAGPIDLIILSIDQLQVGCEFAARLRGTNGTADVPIIFLVPEISAVWTTQLQAHGGVYCLLKPVDSTAICDLVEKALWMPHLVQRRSRLPDSHLQRATDWVRLESDRD